MGYMSGFFLFTGPLGTIHGTKSTRIISENIVRLENMEAGESGPGKKGKLLIFQGTRDYSWNLRTMEDCLSERTGLRS
jgi:hypothetical protein